MGGFLLLKMLEQPEIFYREGLRIQSQLGEDQHAQAIYQGFWAPKMWAAVENDQLDRFNKSRQMVEGFINKNIPTSILEGRELGMAQTYDHFFGAIDWHRRNFGEENLQNLIYLGIDHRGAETVWKDLTYMAADYIQARPGAQLDQDLIGQLVEERKATVNETKSAVDKKLKGFCDGNAEAVDQVIAEVYRADQGKPTLEDRLFGLADQTLADKLKLPEEVVPFSFAWFRQQERFGVIIPQTHTLIALNRAVLDGKPVDLYCCPNYALERREDGTFAYTFESLGEDIGLTAERGFPLVHNLIDRVTDLRTRGVMDKPLNLRIAIADFEATEDNAQMVGLTLDQFKRSLGGSVNNMVNTVTQEFHSRNGHGGRVDVAQTNPGSEIGEYQVGVSQNGVDIAKVSFGAITQTFVGQIPGYEGIDSFNSFVEEKRDELAHKADADPDFQRRLDAISKLRLGLMLKWRDGSEPEVIGQLGKIFDMAADNRFSRPIEGLEYHPDLQEQLNHVMTNGYNEAEKNEIVKRMIVTWLTSKADSDPQAAEALSYLRRKVARQGAEYSVMSHLKRQAGGGAQIVADSAPMWEVFGGNSIARVAVKGGYEGAEN